jgi:hypothetical protein
MKYFINRVDCILKNHAGIGVKKLERFTLVLLNIRSVLTLIILTVGFNLLLSQESKS